MKIRISFGPVADAYLREVYRDNLTFKQSDKVSLFIFSQFKQPGPGEILIDNPTGVLVTLPDQFVNDNRIFISEKSRKYAQDIINGHLKDLLYMHLTVTLQRKGELKLCILAFMERYNLTLVTDYEMWKQSYFRYRKKQK